MLDSNVLIDMLEEDPAWSEWSFRAMVGAKRANEAVAVSVIVVAELVSATRGRPHLLAGLAELGIVARPFDNAAALAAGHAQHRYRLAGGSRDKLLGDFLIGGHALALGATLITRDPRRYRRYFPDLTLITPETHPYV